MKYCLFKIILSVKNNKFIDRCPKKSTKHSGCLQFLETPCQACLKYWGGTQMKDLRQNSAVTMRHIKYSQKLLLERFPRF